MRIFGKTSTAPNYLFGLLPHYFKDQDNGAKDVSGYIGEGRLERYLQIFCAELDDELSDYIEDVGFIVDALGLDNLPHSAEKQLDFLIPIADTLSKPPDIGTVDQYKNLLRHIRQIHQTRGSKESLLLFLALFGYTISDLDEETQAVKTYDGDPWMMEYDKGGLYDYGLLIKSGFDLVITDYPGTTTGDPGSTWLDLLKEALQQFIAPIGCIVYSVTYV